MLIFLLISTDFLLIACASVLGSRTRTKITSPAQVMDVLFKSDEFFIKIR